MRRSETQCLAILETHGPRELTRYEIYRAHVALANNGLAGEHESLLDSAQRSLLDVRRRMNRGELKEARQELTLLEFDSPILLADKIFLLAAVAHRSGDLPTARAMYAEAAHHYGVAGDHYRRIRALINARISENNVDHYVIGSLFAIEQDARSNGFDGLVGIIQKARAGELFSRGKFIEALAEIESAIENLSRDGCPEDLAVARLLAALCQLVAGNLEAAKSHYGRVCLTGGKLSVYQNAYQNLLDGKTPQAPKGHPLDGTPWPRFAVKKEALPARILRRLQTSPATPDELIEELWGKNAIHPSYRNRLFVAVNKLKKATNQAIVFDGRVYRLS